MESRICTYRTRFIADINTNNSLDAFAALMSRVVRTLFADLQAGKKLNKLKSGYLRAFGITARQFNSCRLHVEGVIKSQKALIPLQIADLARRIASLEKQIKKTKSPGKRHQQKRRLGILQARKAQLEADKKNGTVRVCFGSKELFKQQFFLEENGYSDHSEWANDWREARSNEFFIVGSKDETGGNQSCTLILQKDGTFHLRLRLPDALKETYATSEGKYIVLTGLYFQYGHEEIVKALARKQAISFRLKRDDKGWEVLATVTLPARPVVSNALNGAIGVDLNTDHLAVAELDHAGNIIDKQTIPLNLRGKTSKQRAAIVGDACALVVERAVTTRKPIVIEDLDFSQKKAQKDNTAIQARTIHSFAYTLISQMLISRAWRHGIEVEKVNPAYTSVIGLVKFKDRHGLSVHHAAAACIARRFLGFSERPPRRFISFKDDRGNHFTFPLPARNVGEPVWCFWDRVAREIQAVYAAHYWKMKNRSRGSPPQTAKPPGITGGIPVRESLAVLLG